MAVPAAIAARAEKLRREIERANYNYYVKDAPTLPDAEYDRLFRELQELENAIPGTGDAGLADPARRRCGAVEAFAQVTHRGAHAVAQHHDRSAMPKWRSAFDRRVRRELSLGGRRSADRIRRRTQVRRSGHQLCTYENGVFARARPAATATPARTSPPTCARAFHPAAPRRSQRPPAVLEVRGEVMMLKPTSRP